MGNGVALESLVVDLALMLITAAIISLIFKRFRQPLVLGYIVAGFLISPNFIFFPTIVDEASIEPWAQIGVIFLMFALGLEFSFHRIANIGSTAIIMATTIILSMTVTGFITGKLLGWSNIDAIFLGGMISLSSTMIILKSFEEYHLKKERFAELVLGAMVIEDIAAVFMIIVLSTIGVKNAPSGIAIIGEIETMLLLLIIWLTAGIYLIPTILKKLHHYLTDEILLIISIAICLGMVLIAHMIGFSEALGAFMAGSILAGTSKSSHIDKLIQPLKNLFVSVFFISVGMMLDPALLIKYVVPIIIISAVVILGQSFFGTLGVLLAGQDLKTAVKAGHSTLQIGEFSFIIASLGTGLGVTSRFLYPIIVCVSIITIFITPMAMKSSNKSYLFIVKRLPQRTLAFIRSYTSKNKTETDKDPDWRNYLKKYFIRTLIATGAIFAIILMGVKGEQFIYRIYPTDHFKILMAGLILVVLLPFISLMNRKPGDLYYKLWIKSRTNRFPLILLRGFRMLLSAAAIISVMYVIADINIIIPSVISIFIIGFIVKSDFLKSTTIKMETRFICNFNEKLLKAEKEKRHKSENHDWVDEQFYIVTFRIKHLPPKNEIKEFCPRDKFGVNVIRVIRNGKYYSIPEPTMALKENDIVVAMGTKDRIGSYLVFISSADYIENPKEKPVTLRDYTAAEKYLEIDPDEEIVCCAIIIKPEMQLHKKTIQASAFKEKFTGLIIGIERDDLPILSPDKSLVLENNDLLWALGKRTLISNLLDRNMLDI